MSDSSLLLEARLSRIKKALHLEKPDRVPVFSLNGPEIAIDYCDRQLKAATWDLEILRNCLSKYYHDLNVDATGSTFLRPPLLYTTTGSQNFISNKEGFMQHPDVCGMLETEYGDLIKDPFKTLVEKVLPRQYREFAKPGALGGLNLAKGALTYCKTTRILKEIDQYCSQSAGVPIITDNAIEAPFDFLSDQLRGFSGISMDLHRRPEEVEQACEALLPLMFRWGISGYEGLPKELPCIIMPLHMPPFLNPRQFDRFYWPTFEKLVNGLTCRGYTVTLFFEGDWSKYYDHLTALKPHLIGIFEYGELKVIKEKLGKTMCIMGNYPIGALKSDSTEKCIDIAKKILDAAAPGGGYIFTTGKALLRGREIDFEKLKAVHNFVIENGRY